MEEAGQSERGAAAWWRATTEDPRLALTLVAAAAILARLAFLALEPRSELRGDEPSWLALADHEVLRLRRPFSPFRSGLLFYPPLYPYFLAASKWLFGSFAAALVVQAVLGALGSVAVLRIGTRAFSPAIGVGAGLVMALHPELVWFSAHYWSETLFMALFWWAIERATAAADRPVARVAFVAGLLWGLAALTRETALYVAPLAVIHLALAVPRAPISMRRDGHPVSPGRAWRLSAPLAFVLGLVLAVGPWTWRNHVVFGAFVPISTFGALNLWQGNSPLSRDDLYVVSDSVEGPIAQYRLARTEAWRAIRARQPWWLFQKIRKETLPFWSCCGEAVLHFERGAYTDPPRGAPLAVFGLIGTVYGLLLLGFLVGVRDFLRAPHGRFLGLLLLAYFSLHLAAYSVDRFRLPLLPVLALGAAGTAAGGWRPTRAWHAWAALALVGALLLHSIRSCPVW